MQKRPSVSETKEEISDIQNDPVVQKLFEDAMEVLRLAGADEKATVEYPSSEVSNQATHQRVLRREKKQIKQSKGKQAQKSAAITKSKRRKLERIKAPVTILRKTKQVEVPSEDEQETAVQKMLCYVDQMPSQETFQPPALPFVSVTMDNNENENAANDNPPNYTESIQDYTYLSNEKDVALWKMLLASPTNCNVFVGDLGHGVTSEILHTAFEAFSLKEDDKPQIKSHVVMDVARNQSKGYGFVSFPCRRSAELAMICMQDFEIYGRAMQLGWGQENREEQPSSIEESQETKIGQQQHEKESPTRTLLKPKGDIVSDTVFSDEVNITPKPSLKRCSSRWDQETPKQYQRIEESVKLDNSQGDPTATQKNKEDSFLLEVPQPVLLLNSQLKDSNLKPEEHSTSDQLLNKGEDEIKSKILHEKDIDCKPAVEFRKQRSVKRLKVDDETGLKSVSQEISLDVKGTHFDMEGFSSSSGVEQDPSRFVIEIEKGVETRGSSTDEQIFCGKARPSSSTDQNPRKAIQWLTHDQKVALIRSVCSKLRGYGVRGHLGVFGVHYEADNSRLYIVCAKTVTEAQLRDEFKVFGTADVKLNKDVNGFSKGCAFVQYTDSTCAERAIKQLHGKVVGGMPMKVMVAEPKVRKGSRGKKTVV